MTMTTMISCARMVLSGSSSSYRCSSFPRRWLLRSATARRSIWSTGTDPPTIATHPLHALTPSEVSRATAAAKSHLLSIGSVQEVENLRFVVVTAKEPSPSRRAAAAAAASANNDDDDRAAELVVLNTETGLSTEMLVSLPRPPPSGGGDGGDGGDVTKCEELPRGVQPMLTPEDCDLAESVVKNSSEVQSLLRDRYGLTDLHAQLAADPWSVHLADDADQSMTESSDPTDETPSRPRRLVQTFLYQRMYGEGLEDNHYAHPIDLLPVVDLISAKVVRIDGVDRMPPPKVPSESVNYHRNLVSTNSYLQRQWRTDRLKALHITQPDGPSFTVSDQNFVRWQNWTFRVGFNYREGLVLHDVKFDGRSVVNKASLVEMAVPYGDPHPPFQRKCAFDVGDYGLGNCANSLELGCDCLGHIHYFDGILNTAEGEPKIVKKVVCMHEEDDGLLWKHVEYRNGHSESRRSRELVISSIATVVNYEYLFYWRLKLDGSIDFEIRLSGELSTNAPSAGEDPTDPRYGTVVAHGVNAQVHQHMFCARLDMAVDGDANTVSEIDVEPLPVSDSNPYGNAFVPVETIFRNESDAIRRHDASRARSWKISNAEGRVNPITGKPVAYKLHPFTRGPSHPTLLTDPSTSAVSRKGAFATAHLWVTPHDEAERFPAGEYTPQQVRQDGLPLWTKSNRNIESENVVLWHAFGVTHVPRVEDFPVMPYESTGFTLKPDGFSSGNPTIDIEPETNTASKLDDPSSSCCD